MKKGIVIGVIIACLFTLAFLCSCASHNTEITPATSKVERNSVYEKPQDSNERVIEIDIYPPGTTPPSRDVPKAGDVEEDLGYAAEEGFDVGLAYVEPEPGVEIIVDGKKVVAPPGSVVQMRMTEKDQRNGEKRNDKASAESKGAGLKTDNANLVPSFNSSAPNSELEGTGSGSGGLSKFATVFATPKASMWTAYIFGFILIAGGIFVWAGLGARNFGLAGIAGGIACIAVGVIVEQYPWLFLLIFLVILGVAGYLLWQMYVAKRNTNVLKAVVQGVDSAGDAAAPVKEKIAEAAEETGAPVKRVVTKLKDELGL